MSAVPTSQPDPASPGDPAAAPELFIVLNLRSGHEEKGAVRAAIEAELRHSGRRYRFLPVGRQKLVPTMQQAARLAQEHGGWLVAAGGDGTLNCAAQAAFTHDCPLGIVAQGTFNLFARQHGLSLDAAEATRLLLRSQPQPVQVGWVNQRLFLVNASVGLYPKLLADRELAKRRLGRRRFVALLSGLVSLFEWRQQLALDAELDGQVTRLLTPSLFVCNNRLQLERVGVEEAVVAAVGEGRLAGLAARSNALRDKLCMMWHGLRGRLAEDQALDSFTLRSLSVTHLHARRMKVATDGEVLWMDLPLRFAVAPRPLQLLLPPPQDRLPVR